MAETKVICQKWVEFGPKNERRPDGYTLHLNATDRAAYIADFWAKSVKPTPEVYSMPYGTPYETMVDEDTFAELLTRENGLSRNGELPLRVGQFVYV